MISIIAYVIHFYILPRKTYSGLYCIEEWLRGTRAWNTTFDIANWLDIYIFVLVAIYVILKLIKTKDTSSKAKG